MTRKRSSRSHIAVTLISSRRQVVVPRFDVPADSGSVGSLRRAVLQHLSDHFVHDAAASSIIVTFPHAQTPLSDDTNVLSRRNSTNWNPSNPLVVVVPIEMLKHSKWRQDALSAFPPLTMPDHSQLFRAPQMYLTLSGIPEDQDLLLHMRRDFHSQWTKNQQVTVDTYSLLWIVGPPGVGKSCTAFAFACSMERPLWEVLWIHHDKVVGCFNFIRFIGDDKMTFTIADSQIETALAEILVDSGRPTIVFLDGYVDCYKPCSTAYDFIKSWKTQNEIMHRFVVVCSMANAGLKTLHTKVIPRRVYLHSLQVETHAADDKSPIRWGSVHFMSSWTLNEYTDAIKHEEFYQQVEKYLDCNIDESLLEDPDLTVQEQRVMLLTAKFFVGGGSARFMFCMSECLVKEEINYVMTRVRNLVDAAEGLSGPASKDYVNRLFAENPGV